MKINRKILLGLTTTKGSDWREKVEEINHFNIREIALFATGLNPEERKELYQLLERSVVERIPHVHMRDDMNKEELDYLTDRFKVEVFNFHPDEWGRKLLKHEEYLDRMYVENLTKLDDEFMGFVDRCAGICLDVSHWEDHGVLQGKYKLDKAVLEKNKIGCCHISAVKKNISIDDDYITGKKIELYSDHILENLSELDYVRKYISYLPDTISIELKNPLSEQLNVKEYLEKMINDNPNKLKNIWNWMRRNTNL